MQFRYYVILMAPKGGGHVVITVSVLGPAPMAERSEA